MKDSTPASTPTRPGWSTRSSRGSSQQAPAAVRIGVRLLVVSLCALAGWGLTQLGHPAASYELSHPPQASDMQPLASEQMDLKQITTTTDPVPSQFELGHQLYLENCATCHVGVPPAVLPQQSWVDIIQDTQHYGVQLPPLVDPGRLLIAQYLIQFSRSLQEEERTPYRIRNSRTFKALHPRVEFETPLVVNSCVSCHPGAPDFNYRLLSPEWQDAP